MSFFKDRNYYLKDYNLSFSEKAERFNYIYLFFVFLIVCTGFLALYSVGGGNFVPWTQKQFFRFVVGLIACLVIASVNLRFWMRYAYAIYGAALISLVAVSLFGHVGMGAQRWLNFGFVQIQPSEMMKVALVLALARYFHGRSVDEIRSVKFLIAPLLLMAVPVALILEQPDLGTALMLVFVTFALLFAVGVQLWKFVVLIGGGLVALPIAWSFLHDYQRKRVLTFLNPENDPLGAGYHIMQSKITLGSGGAFGKGFLQGTQSRLNFIPEKQTDFIFTVLSEEFGFMGSFALLLLYCIVIGYGFYIANKCQSFFGKLLVLGLTINFALYVFINMAMVMGLMPVVGVPLPLVSYGGTAMLTLMIGVGLIECADINHDMVIGRRGSIDDE